MIIHDTNILTFYTHKTLSSYFHAVFIVEEVSANDTDDDRLSPIENEDAEISIPREVLEAVGNGEPVRMASFLFRNKSGLLPERLERSDNTRSALSLPPSLSLSLSSHTHTHTHSLSLPKVCSTLELHDVPGRHGGVTILKILLYN